MNLSYFEKTVFSLLESSVGKTVERTQLEAALLQVRPSRMVPSENSNVLEVLIGRIRRKLPPGSTIKAIRGRGYVLRVVAMCDSCQEKPGTSTVMAAGTETFACDDCPT